MLKLASVLARGVAPALALLIACHHTAPVAPARVAPTPVAPPAPVDTTPIAQLEQGRQLFIGKCAGCHGEHGEGTDKAPPLVGPEAFPVEPRAGADRDVAFHTAADVLGWTAQHMPADNPGGLTSDEYLAICAFDLTANGVKLTAPLDLAAAQAIALHP